MNDNLREAVNQTINTAKIDENVEQYRNTIFSKNRISLPLINGLEIFAFLH